MHISMGYNMKFQYRYTLYEIRLNTYFFKISTIWFLVKNIPNPFFWLSEVHSA